MRLFLDRDIGTSIGHALRAVKVDVELYSERYDDPMVSDDRWIAEVTAEGLVILSKDTHLGRRPAERAVIEAAGARAFIVATRGAKLIDNLRGILIAWPDMVRIVDEVPAPFMFGLNRSGNLTQYLPPPAAPR